MSAYPRAVTTAIFRAIAKGQAASSVLSAAQGMTLMLVDVGVDADVADLQGDGVNVVVRHAKVGASAGELAGTRRGRGGRGVGALGLTHIVGGETGDPAGLPRHGGLRYLPSDDARPDGGGNSGGPGRRGCPA